MSGGRLAVAGAALLLAFAALFGVGRHGGAPGPPSRTTGRAVPAFALPQLHDPSARFGSERLRGEVAVLNVWASWCMACRAEHPLLMSLAEREGAVFYGLNYRDDRADALRWLEFYGDPYRVSASDASGAVADGLGIRGVPTTVVIDGEGVVRYRHGGPLDEKDWREQVAPLLRRLDPGRAS